MNRGITILLATGATVLAVLAFLLIPLSIAVGHLANIVGELIVLVVSVAYVARVMRADRRRRRESEAALPPERRVIRREPRRPITFQVRETLFAFAIWFAIIATFNAFVLRLGPLANAGIALFAAFMLATLTVTGRHMMFRLIAEDDAPMER